MRFPKLNEVKTVQKVTTAFEGYNHTDGIKENQFFDMRNMTSDRYPLLCPRDPYEIARTINGAQGLYAHNKLCWAAGNKFYYDGEEKGGVSAGEKQLVGMGSYVTIWPDKKIYKSETGEFDSLSAEDTTAYPGYTSELGSPEIIIEPIEMTGLQGEYMELCVSTASFHVGDVVIVEYPHYISTGGEPDDYIIRYDQIYSRIAYLVEGTIKDKIYVLYNQDFVFTYREYINFTLNSPENDPITVKRPVPDMDFVCECNNRLWGCSSAKHEIYASALGDPYNWNVFEGISQDSYVLTVGSTGDFTGVGVYGDSVLFFKEDCIHRIYGTKPSNYQLTTTICSGVQKGCEKSLCILNETLFYKSRYGVCAYSGGLPSIVSSALGSTVYTDAVAGALGDKLYLCMKTTDDNDQAVREILVFDTQKRIWSKEERVNVGFFAKYGSKLYFTDADDGKLYAIDSDGAERADNAIRWFAQTGKFMSIVPGNKIVSKIQIKATVPIGAYLKIEMRYDSYPRWEKRYEAISRRSMCYTIPIIPRRCDHFEMRISGAGYVCIHSISRQTEQGSEL